MLQNAYSFAKIGAETAENERNFAENLPKLGNYPTGPAEGRPGDRLRQAGVQGVPEERAGRAVGVGAAAAGPSRGR